MSKYKRVNKKTSLPYSDDTIRSITHDYAERKGLTREEMVTAEHNLRVKLHQEERHKRVLSLTGAELYPTGHRVKARSKRGWTTKVK